MKWWDSVYLYLLQTENDSAEQDYVIEYATTEQNHGGLCIMGNPYMFRKIDVARYSDLEEWDH